MKVAAVQRDDGGISFAPIVRERREDESPEEFTALCFRRLLAEHPAAKIIGVIDDSDLPARDEFRNAWAFDGDRVGVDMERARDIQRDKLRALRAPVLDALDVAALRAIERGDSRAQQDVAMQKQALRDLPNHPSIESASTLDELRAAGMSVIEGGK